MLPFPGLLPGIVGVDAESERIQKLLSELEGKDLQAVMAEGKGKLAAMPAAGPATASAGPAAGGGAPAAKKEEKKEEKPESDEVGAHGCCAQGQFERGRRLRVMGVSFERYLLQSWASLAHMAALADCMFRAKLTCLVGLHWLV